MKLMICFSVSYLYFLDSSLTPPTGGKKVTISISSEGFSHTLSYFFALKTKDHNDNWSGVSNIVKVKLPKIQCPEGWIDAQSQNLGCVNFVNEVSQSWFEAHEVCQEKYSGYLVEALTGDEAKFLFEMAEMIQLYSSTETWWIGLTDFFGRYLTLQSIFIIFKQ